MYNITNTYFTSKQAGKVPIVLCRIETQRTSYLFFARYPNDDETGSLSGIDLWDGSVNTGDGGTFGGLPVSIVDARVLQFGSISKALVANAKDLPASLTQSRIGSYSVTFDNHEYFFSKLLGDDQNEPLLGQKLKILQGFKGDEYSDFVILFDGEISQVSLTSSRCRVIAEDLATVFPSDLEVETSPTTYAVIHDGSSEMAETQFTAAQLYTGFLVSDTWLFTSNFIKDDLGDAGIFFEIESTNYYGATVLQIGIDNNNYPFVTVGRNVETSPTTLTYTSTTALTASDITRPLNLRVYFDAAATEVTFAVAETSTTVSTTLGYDRALTSDCYIRLGNGFDGDIQNWVWNTSAHYWVNNQGDNTLLYVPEVIGALDNTLTGGSWNAWPKI